MMFDIFSLVVGGVLWEIISAYIHFVAAPRYKRYKERKKEFLDNTLHRQTCEDYTRTSMGFNCQFNE